MSNTPQPQTIKDAALTFALRKTVADLVADEVKAERQRLQDRLLERMVDEGVKQTAVTLPDGTPVATLTVAQPSPRDVVDDAALLAWCQEHRPEWVTTVEHPAVEAWTEHRVDLDAVKAAKLATVDGQAVTEDGEVVEGITRRTPPPSSFAVKYAPGGREAIVGAYHAGQLGHLALGATLPAITAAADPETDAEWAEIVDEDGAQDTPPADPETDGPEVDAPAPVDGPPAWSAPVDGPPAWTPGVSL